MKQKELHSEHGEDCLELLKLAFESEHNSRCEMCKEWVGNPLESRCPYPFPNAKRPGKYCKLDETPTVNRKVDDYHPKVQAIIAQSEGKLKATDEESMKEFCSKFGSDDKIVKTFVLHLEVKECKSFARAEERCKLKQIEQGKTSADYDWRELYDSGKLRKLKNLTSKNTFKIIT